MTQTSILSQRDSRGVKTALCRQSSLTGSSTTSVVEKPHVPECDPEVPHAPKGMGQIFLAPKGLSHSPPSSLKYVSNLSGQEWLGGAPQLPGITQETQIVKIKRKQN